MSDTEVYCIVGNIIGRQPHNGEMDLDTKVTFLIP